MLNAIDNEYHAKSTEICDVSVGVYLSQWFLIRTKVSAKVHWLLSLSLLLLIITMFFRSCFFYFYHILIIIQACKMSFLHSVFIFSLSLSFCIRAVYLQTKSVFASLISIFLGCCLIIRLLICINLIANDKESKPQSVLFVASIPSIWGFIGKKQTNNSNWFFFSSLNPLKWIATHSRAIAAVIVSFVVQ